MEGAFVKWLMDGRAFEAERSSLCKDTSIPKFVFKDCNDLPLAAVPRVMVGDKIIMGIRDQVMQGPGYLLRTTDATL